MKSFIQCTVAIGALACCQAHAGGIVNSATEADLRAALVGGNNVTFAIDGTITLAAELTITNDTTIDATGHEVVISGNNTCRLFNVQPGVSLILKSLTLSNGQTKGVDGTQQTDAGPGRGGAVFANGSTITAVDCAFLGNTAKGGDGVEISIPHPLKAGVGEGGAIYVADGNVNLTNCVLGGNSAIGGKSFGGRIIYHLPGGEGSGGAIHISGGQLNLASCAVFTNASLGGVPFSMVLGPSGPASGGAIELRNAMATILGTTLNGNFCHVDNVSPARGGAVCQSGGIGFFVNTTFSGNCVSAGQRRVESGDASPGFGGALFLCNGVTGFTNTSFSFNSAKGGASNAGFPAAGLGGGVSSSNHNSYAVNCTFADNRAHAGSAPFGVPGPAFGGGLHAVNTTNTLVNVTFANNAALPNPLADEMFTPTDLLGGNIYVEDSIVALLNSIIDASRSGSNSHGLLIDLGYNISSDASCYFTATGSLNNTDPKLGPLADYGGSTPTMSLLVGSPAIDAAHPSTSPPTDQRGRVRPFGGSADVGAFESSPPYSIQGRVSGPHLEESVVVAVDGYSSTSTSDGAYILTNLATGFHNVAPSHSAYRFIPHLQTISVGPDQIGIDFKAYRTNLLTSDGISNNTARFVYAGTEGQPARLQASTNLILWVPIQTNVIPQSHTLEILLPLDGAPKNFFRIVCP